MDTQKVEQYAGVVRKVSKGLKIWNIIGIVGNVLGLLGMAILLIPQVQEQLATVKNPYLTKENIGFGIAVLVVFLLICIFSTILYHKIGESAKAQVLPEKNLLHYAIGVFAFSIVMQVVNQLMSGLGFDITAYIFPAIVAGLLAWVYVTYQKWEQEVAKQ